jgi:hypothetical protein
LATLLSGYSYSGFAVALVKLLKLLYRHPDLLDEVKVA